DPTARVPCPPTSPPARSCPPCCGQRSAPSRSGCSSSAARQRWSIPQRASQNRSVLAGFWAGFVSLCENYPAHNGWGCVLWAAAQLLDDDAGAAGALDGLAGGRRELVGMHRERLRDLALGEDLDRHVAALAQAPLLERVERDVGALVE